MHARIEHDLAPASCSAGAQSSARPRSVPRPSSRFGRRRGLAGRSRPRRSRGRCVPRDPCPTRSCRPGTDTLAEDRAHHRADDGEPLLRQLPRHARPRRRLHVSTARAARPTTNPDVTATPCTRSACPRRASSGAAVAGVERDAPLRCRGRNDGFVMAGGPVAMGYWTQDGPALLLRRSHGRSSVRPLVRLGARLDLPEPPLPASRARPPG